jgi:hypothetical protein
LELDRLAKENLRIRKERDSLQIACEELQRLTIETPQTSSSSSMSYNSPLGKQLKQAPETGTDELLNYVTQLENKNKVLEGQLFKTHKEKEKALKLVMAIIGPERVAEHLRRNAGRENILDSLITAFGPEGRYRHAFNFGASSMYGVNSMSSPSGANSSPSGANSSSSSSSGSSDNNKDCSPSSNPANITVGGGSSGSSSSGGEVSNKTKINTPSSRNSKLRSDQDNNSREQNTTPSPQKQQVETRSSVETLFNGGQQKY